LNPKTDPPCLADSVDRHRGQTGDTPRAQQCGSSLSFCPALCLTPPPCPLSLSLSLFSPLLHHNVFRHAQFCCCCCCSGDPSGTPQQGWLLVWTGTGSKQETHPSLSSAAAAGSGTSIIPGGPSFTVMAWPSKGGDTWSGCVFTYPQVGATGRLPMMILTQCTHCGVPAAALHANHLLFCCV
jgi:hypothetical protein